MTSRKRLSLACACALALWTPVASAELRGVQETRSGVLKFESNGYPTAETVARVREEIDYQRAVQAYIHFVPAVAIQLNPLEERDMLIMQGLRNLGIEKGRPFAPTAAQKKILEEAALVGETWTMGNSFLKPSPVKHWTDDPKSQWQYILFMESALDQMAKTHMEIDARTAHTYEAITVTEASTQNLVDAGIQYLASYKDDAGQWLDGNKTYDWSCRATSRC